MGCIVKGPMGPGPSGLGAHGRGTSEGTQIAQNRVTYVTQGTQIARLGTQITGLGTQI